MGKEGKLRKKRKLMNQVVATAKAAAVDENDVGGSPGLYDGISDVDLSITVHTLDQLSQNPDTLKQKRYKMLRKVLFQLGYSSNAQGAPKSSTGLVSDMIKNYAWKEAREELKGMLARGEKPKLGAMQRWVRECDATQGGEQTTEALLVLDAVLRVAHRELIGYGVKEGAPFKERETEPVREYGEFRPIEETLTRPPASEEDGIRVPSEDVRQHYAKKFRVCLHQEGAERTPPNHHPLDVVTSEPGTIEFLAGHGSAIERVDVPCVPNAFVLTNVLTREECLRFINAAESAGYFPDEPIGGQPGGSILAHACVWMVDTEIDRIVTERVQKFLPQEGFRGINRRWRFYRYVPGRYYRPHIDGAWPPSGFDANGDYCYDISEGKIRSKWTFLIYFNDDFEGGWTTYFMPAKEEGIINAFPVKPRAGCVLVFPHGDVAESLLHEGSPVLARAKYVVRTDVEYEFDGQKI